MTGPDSKVDIDPNLGTLTPGAYTPPRDWAPKPLATDLETRSRSGKFDRYSNVASYLESGNFETQARLAIAPQDLKAQEELARINAG